MFSNLPLPLCPVFFDFFTVSVFDSHAVTTLAVHPGSAGSDLASLHFADGWSIYMRLTVFNAIAPSHTELFNSGHH